MDDDEPDLYWETMGETLMKAGVTWKVFQEQDNFDDNAYVGEGDSIFLSVPNIKVMFMMIPLSLQVCVVQAIQSCETR